MMQYQASKHPAGRRHHPTVDLLVGGQGSERAGRRATLAGYYVAGLLLLAAGWLFSIAYQNFAMAQRVTSQTLGAAADLEHVPVGRPVVVTGRIDAQTAVADDRRRLTMYVDWKWEPKNTLVEARRVAPPFALAVTDGSVPIANEG